MKPKDNNRYDLEIGKMPPQSIEIESAVLGALILEPNAILEINRIMPKNMFYKEANGIIYEAIMLMHDRDIKIDMLQVCNELKKVGKLDEVGGMFYISGLTNNVASAAHIEHHALVMKEMFIKREFIRITTHVMNMAYDDSKESGDLLSTINKEIESIYSSDLSGAVTILEGVNQVIEDIKSRQGKKEVAGFKSDLDNVKKFIPVFENSRLIVIAARPGMGKTGYAIHEALNASDQNVPTLFFSLEMSCKQLIKRLMLTTELVNRKTLDSNNIDNDAWAKIDMSINKIQDHKIWIDDNSFTIQAIKNQSKIFKKKVGIGAIFIDYLQLIEGNKYEVRERQVANIARSLKLLSKELDLPIFLLAQLNRESENRKTEGYKPKLADLRESGAIEQDADIVAFPHRPEYYDNEDQSIKGKAWLIIAKNRDGKTGNAEILVNESVTKFKNPVSEQQEKIF